MIESQGVCYIARSKTPLTVPELQFHLHQNFSTVQDQVKELVARGYAIIGYTNSIGFFNLEDRLMPGESVQEMDLALMGPMASQLMPKERWRFGLDLKPKPTVREMEEEIRRKIERPLVLAN